MLPALNAEQEGVRKWAVVVRAGRLASVAGAGGGGGLGGGERRGDCGGGCPEGGAGGGEDGEGGPGEERQRGSLPERVRPRVSLLPALAGEGWAGGWCEGAGCLSGARGCCGEEGGGEGEDDGRRQRDEEELLLVRVLWGDTGRYGEIRGR